MGQVNFSVSSLIIKVPSDIFSAVCERLFEKWPNCLPTARKAINPPLSSQMCDSGATLDTEMSIDYLKTAFVGEAVR